jgi:hydroxymethylbilane synthase
MTPLHYRIGTRGSKLAITQTQIAIDLLHAFVPDVVFPIEIIASHGDIHSQTPIQNLGEKGLFTAELEKQLLAGTVDFVVHSAKDLPTQRTPGLTIAAYPKRADPSEVLVSRNHLKFADLPPSAIIGTSSPRRKCQLARLRSDLTFADIRGNVDTRIRKVREGHFDAAVMARAGLHRLGLETEIAEVFSTDLILPAAGQGALAIQCRSDDRNLISLLSSVNHEPTAIGVQAERKILEWLEAGCSCPIGVLAQISSDGSMTLRACLCDPATNDRIDAQASGSADHWQALVQKVAGRLQQE